MFLGMVEQTSLVVFFSAAWYKNDLYQSLLSTDFSVGKSQCGGPFYFHFIETNGLPETLHKAYCGVSGSPIDIPSRRPRSKCKTWVPTRSSAVATTTAAGLACAMRCGSQKQKRWGKDRFDDSGPMPEQGGPCRD